MEVLRTSDRDKGDKERRFIAFPISGAVPTAFPSSPYQVFPKDIYMV